MCLQFGAEHNFFFFVPFKLWKHWAERLKTSLELNIYIVSGKSLAAAFSEGLQMIYCFFTNTQQITARTPSFPPLKSLLLNLNQASKNRELYPLQIANCDLRFIMAYKNKFELTWFRQKLKSNPLKRVKNLTVPNDHSHVWVPVKLVWSALFSSCWRVWWPPDFPEQQEKKKKAVI